MVSFFIYLFIATAFKKKKKKNYSEENLQALIKHSLILGVYTYSTRCPNPQHPLFLMETDTLYTSLQS